MCMTAPSARTIDRESTDQAIDFIKRKAISEATIFCLSPLYPNP